MAEARAAAEAAAERTREASEACSRASEEDAPPEYMDRLAQEEAAASSALAEAQDQVCLWKRSKTCKLLHLQIGRPDMAQHGIECC